MLALRPDMTTPIARVAVMRMRERPLPLRLFYLANVFRQEETQAGRQCEFYQAGVELLGAGGVAADAEVVALAVEARACAVASGDVPADTRLAVIDYSRPSTDKRLWVFDLANERLLFNEYVSHGQGSGEKYATRFSNVEGSFATSLGLYRTAETYQGKHGYSLRLDGLSPGKNCNARKRAIVVHGADYASPRHLQKYDKLGRSWGCPALPREQSRAIIDIIKGGSVIYAHG